MSPFEILKEDFDDFALMVNYHLENGEKSEGVVKESFDEHENVRRVRVTDKTASGGWF